MTDSVIIAAPLLIAAIVMAVRFVGCRFDTSGIPGPKPTQSSTDYSTTVTSIPSLVSYWQLNDAKGSPTAFDSKDGNTGTYQPGVTLGAQALANVDAKNSAAAFDGTMGYVEIPNKGNNLNPATFTVEALVQPSVIDPSNRRTIVSFFDDPDQAGYILALSNTDFEASVGTGANIKTVAVHANAQPNQAFYVAMTYDGSNLELYVEPAATLGDNNQFDKQGLKDNDPNNERYNAAQVAPPYKVPTTNELRIGASTGGGPPGEFFDGIIQDVAVYDAVLSFQDIATHFWVYKTGFATPTSAVSVPPESPAHAPLTIQYPAAGANNYDVPPWCNYLDLILLGGGGGGNSIVPLQGNGGLGGSWATKTLTRGAPGPDGIPWTTTSIAVTVGSGGPTGTNGGDTTATATGMTTLTASGGTQGASPSTTGESPMPLTMTYNGTPYPAGAAQTTPGAAGNAPGGGGGGAPAFGSDGPGAHGAAWVVARQT
jgi:hypothetical protein